MSKIDAVFIKTILKLIGGNNNIINFMNCYTRLRITLKNSNVVEISEIKKTCCCFRYSKSS